MPLYRDEAIVLRTFKLGEADRIITMLSKDGGKIKGVAKGVRKTKSKFGSRLEPMSHVAVQMYSGKGELHIVTQVETIDFYTNIRNDLTRLEQVMALLEAVEHFVQLDESNPRLFQMTLGVLKTLNDRDSATIVAAFYWKLLSASGYEPIFDRCVTCGRSDELVAYAIEEGGVLCKDCRQGVPISSGALELVKKMLSGSLAEALLVEASSTTREVEHLATSTIEHYIERRLRAVHLIS